MAEKRSICPVCGGKLVCDKNSSYTCVKCDAGFSEKDLEDWDTLRNCMNRKKILNANVADV
jgi:hypothetical protein